MEFIHPENTKEEADNIRNGSGFLEKDSERADWIERRLE